jgi:hypothetical protein
MAINSYETALKKWREVSNTTKATAPEKFRLRPELELFFEMSLGSVYESCGKDDIALSCYMRAK